MKNSTILNCLKFFRAIFPLMDELDVVVVYCLSLSLSLSFSLVWLVTPSF